MGKKWSTSLSRNVFAELKAYSLIGNYRYAFYQKYKTFDDALCSKRPFHFLCALPGSDAGEVHLLF